MLKLSRTEYDKRERLKTFENKNFKLFQASPELLSRNGCGCFVPENNFGCVYDTALDRARVLERELQRFHTIQSV
jgi:hypothetical protein